MVSAPPLFPWLMPVTGEDLGTLYEGTTPVLTFTHRFAEKVLKAAKGAKGLVEPSYVYLPGVAGGKEIQEKVGGVEFFSVPIELGVSFLAKMCVLIT